MKLLKTESAQFTTQILSSIQNCYGQATPSPSQLMALYCEIGKSIYQQGEKAFVAYMFHRIQENFPEIKGFSLRNLRRMRNFYEAYKNSPHLMARAQRLNWTQNTVILEHCQSDEERTFYISLALEQNLSKLALIQAIESKTWEHQPAKEDVTAPSAPMSDVLPQQARDHEVECASHVAQRVGERDAGVYQGITLVLVSPDMPILDSG